jgi:hypothetical protein
MRVEETKQGTSSQSAGSKLIGTLVTDDTRNTKEVLGAVAATSSVFVAHPTRFGGVAVLLPCSDGGVLR